MKPDKKKGFNLIESAIVLAFVGFVIGGIWTAAVSVNDQMRANRTISGIIQIASAVQASYQGFAWNVPANSSIIFTPTAIAANLVPQDWVKGGSLISPYGGRVIINRSNFGLEMIGVAIYSSNDSGTSRLTPSQCNRLIVSAANQMKDNTNFIMAQAWSPATSLIYTPPIDTSSVNCQSDVILANFWFRRQ